MAKEGKASDFKRAFSEDGARKTHIGGQALLEGIMMRGKYNWAVAVREPDGSIYVEEHDLASGKGGRGWLKAPLIRGCTALFESLALGFKALQIAADHAFGQEDEGEKHQVEANDIVSELEENFDAFGNAGGRVSFASSESEYDAGESAACKASVADSGQKVAGKGDMESATCGGTEPDCGTRGKKHVRDEASAGEDGGLGKGVMTLSMIMGAVLGIALFIVAPAAITNLIVGEYDENTLLWNIVDGVLRVAVFVFYIWLVGRMEDIKRMFMYHGAEHKAIHCFEHSLPMSPEYARQFPRLHVRCGTAFLIMVMIIAIIVYTVVPVNALISLWGVPDGIPKLALVIAVRIAFLPIIAGISYEITVKWAGSHPDNPIVKVILWPGMQMQYLTTNEPDDGCIECAIAAMQKVLEREEAEEAKANVKAAPGVKDAPAAAVR